MPFFCRALFNTVDYLNKLSIPNQYDILDLQKGRIHTLFHLKRYYEIYSFLCCSQKENKANQDEYFYFCGCCDNYINFMRNYSLYIHFMINKKKLDEIEPYENGDEFIFYICALLTDKKTLKEKYLLESIRLNPLFYDALRELMAVLVHQDELIRIYSTELDEGNNLENQANLVDKTKSKNGNSGSKSRDLKNMSKKYDKKAQSEPQTFSKSLNSSRSVSLYNKLLLWEAFKIEYFLYWYVDLGVSTNRIILINSAEGTNHFFPELQKKIIEQEGRKEETNTFDMIELIDKLRNKENYRASTPLSETKPVDKKNLNHKVLDGFSETFWFINNLKAAYYYSKRQYKQSLALFSNTKSTYFLDFLSHILYIRSDTKGLSILSQYLQSISNFNVESMVCSGNFHSLIKDKEKAIDCFKCALLYRPDMIYLNNFIAHEYLDDDKPEKAIAYFDKCRDYKALFGMGQAYLKLKLNHVAIEMFKKSIHLNRKNSYAWHYLGDTYRKINAFSDAINCFREVHNLNNPVGLLLIGEVYKDQKFYEKAVKYFEKYLKCKEDHKIRGFLNEYYTRIGKKK